MTIQTINVGSYANDSTGDDLRTAFEKVNANFAYLGAGFIVDGTNLGPVGSTNIFAQKNSTNATLEFKSLTSSDSTVEITDNTDSIDLKSNAKLENDPMPVVVAPIYANNILTNPFDLNNNVIKNGDVETTVFGYDVPALAGLFSIMFSSGQIDLDMGTLVSPSSGDIDFNGTGNSNFSNSANTKTTIDFGTFV